MAVAETVAAGDAARPLASAGASRPPILVKFAYCFGQVVESGYLTIATFVFFYYTAVLGLSGSQVGLALGAAMCLDAVGDPLIGSWSDSLRTRFGRRLPAMLVGAPLTFLTMGLLFSPPAGLSPWVLFGWLVAMKMGVRFFASMFNIPFFALGGEMSNDYVERTRIVAWRLLAGIVTSTVVAAVAYSVFFAGVGGLQRPERYPAFGWTIASVVLVGALVCCAGVWRYAASLPQPLTSGKGMLRRLPAELAEVFRNRSFLILFFSLVVFTSAAGIAQALNNHVYVFVWKLRPEMIQLLFYAYLFGLFVGTPATPMLMRWMEKKTACAFGFVLVVAAFAILPILRSSGLFAPTGEAALPWLIGMNFFVGLGSGMVFIAYPAMMADAADEHEHLFGARREGLYFSGLGFGGKAAAGMGALIGGLTLDGLHFPREVGRQVGAVVDEGVLRGLTASWGLLPAALMVVGAFIFAPYALSRRRHAEITETLRVTRAAEVSEGRSS